MTIQLYLQEKARKVNMTILSLGNVIGEGKEKMSAHIHIGNFPKGGWPVIASRSLNGGLQNFSMVQNSEDGESRSFPEIFWV